MGSVRSRLRVEKDPGTAVITGTLAATAIAIFVIPMLFVVVERLTQRHAHVEPPGNRRREHGSRRRWRDAAGGGV